MPRTFPPTCCEPDGRTVPAHRFASPRYGQRAGQRVEILRARTEKTVLKKPKENGLHARTAPSTDTKVLYNKRVEKTPRVYAARNKKQASSQQKCSSLYQRTQQRHKPGTRASTCESTRTRRTIEPLLQSFKLLYNATCKHGHKGKQFVGRPLLFLPTRYPQSKQEKLKRANMRWHSGNTVHWCCLAENNKGGRTEDVVTKALHEPHTTTRPASGARTGTDTQHSGSLAQQPSLVDARDGRTDRSRRTQHYTVC